MKFALKIQFVLGASALLFACSCGTAEKKAKTVDNNGGVDSCVTDADFAVDYTCQSFQNGAVRICAEPPTNNGIVVNNGSTNNGSTNNGSTNNGTTTGETNNVSNNNQTSGYTYFLLRDMTVGNGCDTSDPGSDIMWAELIDDSGNSVSFGTTVDAFSPSLENDFQNSNILNGSAPDLPNGVCPEDFDVSTVYSMGCEGTLLFRFDEEAVEEIHSIVIGEWGTQCGGSSDDTYRLYACTNTDDAQQGNDASCTFELGIGEGITDFALETR